MSSSAGGGKEYLNHLNIALGSCGEFRSGYESFKQANQITDDEYEQLDQLHYKVKNALLKMKKAHREGQWRFPKSKDFLSETDDAAANLQTSWAELPIEYIGIDPLQ